MVLEADGEVIGIAHHDHFAGGHRVPLPAHGLMQVELAYRVVSLRCGALVARTVAGDFTVSDRA
jgi:hypothetical protein